MELMLQKPQGEAVLLTCTADEDMVDAHTLGALTSTGKLGPCLLPCICHKLCIAAGPGDAKVVVQAWGVLDALSGGCHGAASLDHLHWHHACC